LIKTSLAWWTAQIQSQIRLHVDSAAQNLLPRLAARLGYNTARLNLSRLSSRLMTWQVGPTMRTCQLTGRWHGIPTVHADGMLTSWWRHTNPGLAHGSGQLVFGSGQPIWAKKTRVTRGARLCAWSTTPPERDGACGHFRRPISTRFSTVASSLPPLQSGMVKTQFRQLSFLSKIKHPFKPWLWYQLLGIPTPPCADRWCSDSCP
jgi:hypothetical protein